MSRPTSYEIVLRGQPSVRLLRPLVDDFAIDAMADGTTRLIGIVRDPAHLHGILAHLTSVNLVIISIAPFITAHRHHLQRNTMNTTHEQPTVPRPTEAAAEMRAITQFRYGTAEVLTLDTVAVPTPQHDEVLIEVVASGIDRGTCHLMTGTPYLVRLVGYGLTKPKRNIPGSDVAGRVVAVGAGVTRFVPGDEVFGIAKGSLAEYAIANEDNLVIKPANVSFEHAAASAVSGITALQALVDVGRAEPGQRVLIVGASGGVGSFAIQLAKALGTVVTAVASTRSIDFVRSLGADHVVDYTTQDFTEIDKPFDLIVDIGGRNSIRRLRSVLTSTGTLVIVGGEGGNRITGGIGRQLRAMVLSRFLQQRLTTFISGAHHSLIERLAGHIESGAVTPSVRATFPLADAPQAIDQLDTGGATGKTVIIVRDSRGDRVE
jgi:NADPH:quinone reductase-like Zn-dependent oxidoreductase